LRPAAPFRTLVPRPSLDRPESPFLGHAGAETLLENDLLALIRDGTPRAGQAGDQAA
jgi:hypothetical protein